MTRKARIWTGLTLLLILAFNYAVIGIPLFKRSSSIENKSKAMLVSQLKSGKFLKNSEDEYILEILKREKAYLDRRILILNLVGASLGILIASWVVFGVVAHKKS
jgi:hypothetical protein